MKRGMNGPTYCIILQAKPQPVDPGSRLQILLKLALRSFGFRCERVEEIPATVTESVTKGNTPASTLTMASTVNTGEAGRQKRSRKRRSPRYVIQKPD